MAPFGNTIPPDGRSATQVGLAKAAAPMLWLRKGIIAEPAEFLRLRKPGKRQTKGQHTGHDAPRVPSLRIDPHEERWARDPQPGAEHDPDRVTFDFNRGWQG